MVKHKWKRLDVEDEQVVDLYVNQGLHSREVAKRLNCSHQLVFNRLKGLNILPRLRGRAGGRFKFDRKTLIDFYTVRKLRVRDIARELGCSFTTIYEVLHEEDIPLRNFRTRRDVKDESIVDLYSNHRLTLPEVAKRLGCCAATVRHRLIKQGIARRSRGPRGQT